MECCCVIEFEYNDVISMTSAPINAISCFWQYEKWQDLGNQTIVTSSWLLAAEAFLFSFEFVQRQAHGLDLEILIGPQYPARISLRHFDNCCVWPNPESCSKFCQLQ